MFGQDIVPHGPGVRWLFPIPVFDNKNRAFWEAFFVKPVIGRRNKQIIIASDHKLVKGKIAFQKTTVVRTHVDIGKRQLKIIIWFWLGGGVLSGNFDTKLACSSRDFFYFWFYQGSIIFKNPFFGKKVGRKRKNVSSHLAGCSGSIHILKLWAGIRDFIEVLTSFQSVFIKIYILEL